MLLVFPKYSIGIDHVSNEKCMQTEGNFAKRFGYFWNWGLLLAAKKPPNLNSPSPPQPPCFGELVWQCLRLCRGSSVGVQRRLGNGVLT